MRGDSMRGDCRITAGTESPSPNTCYTIAEEQLFKVQQLPIIYNMLIHTRPNQNIVVFPATRPENRVARSENYLIFFDKEQHISLNTLLTH